MYDGLLGIYKRKQQVFNKVFHIFHNGRGGWVKVGRNGGKWRGNNGTEACVGGYKNQGIGLVIESILRDVGWGNIIRGHPKMPCDY